MALTDDTGKHALASLGDGTEVEILAWRPRGRTATRYRVRSICDQSEGWLGADDLRSALQPVPPAPPGSGREDTGRKFSQGR